MADLAEHLKVVDSEKQLQVVGSNKVILTDMAVVVVLEFLNYR